MTETGSGEPKSGLVRSGHRKRTEISIRNYRKPSHKQPGAKEDEVFAKMNKGGDIIGTTTRSEAHSGKEKPIHGGVGILVVDSKTGEIYMPQRSLTKDTDPGCLDFSAGEHHAVNDETGETETWTQTARRGLDEELTMSPHQYKLSRVAGHRLLESSVQKEWGTFYIATITDKSVVRPNDEEIDPEKGMWVKIIDLLEIVDNNPSENNPLNDQKIRPMLLDDLKEHHPFRKSLEKLIPKDS